MNITEKYEDKNEKKLLLGSKTVRRAEAVFWYYSLPFSILFEFLNHVHLLFNKSYT